MADSTRGKRPGGKFGGEYAFEIEKSGTIPRYAKGRGTQQYLVQRQGKERS